MDPRPPVPPFTVESARTKVQAAEDAWNSRDPHRVSLAYTADSVWRNRSEFLTGRPAIVEFLSRKWEREQDYVLRKELWACTENRIAVRFRYEWHDAARDRDVPAKIYFPKDGAGPLPIVKSPVCKTLPSTKICSS